MGIDIRPARNRPGYFESDRYIYYKAGRNWMRIPATKKYMHDIAVAGDIQWVLGKRVTSQTTIRALDKLLKEQEEHESD